MRFLPAACATLVLACCLTMSGCFSSPKQNPEQVREKTAETTAALKQNAKAIAQGVREGWGSDHSVDVNTASSRQLAGLPGMDDELAEKIIAHRPYASPDDLLKKRVLSRQQYDRIASRLTVSAKK